MVCQCFKPLKRNVLSRIPLMDQLLESLVVAEYQQSLVVTNQQSPSTFFDQQPAFVTDADQQSSSTINHQLSSSSGDDQQRATATDASHQPATVDKQSSSTIDHQLSSSTGDDQQRATATDAGHQSATVIDQQLQLCTDDEIQSVSLSQYVAVIYDNKWYPGIVQAVVNSSATVSVMSRSGKSFFWPLTPYVETLPFHELLCTMDGEPVATNKNKTRFHFVESERIDALAAEILSN